MVRDWVESVGLDSDPSSPYERQSAEMLAVLEELESRPSVQAIRNEVV